MKYVYQFGIILAVTFTGEVMHSIIPLPIPASIYGLLIMLFALSCKIIKLEKVKEVSDFLIKIMPLMFIPATVGIIEIWDEISGILLPLVVITIVSTVIVMVVTGKVTEFIIKLKRGLR
jgi:holin-like protein